jgi:hypothetical protein
MEPHVGSYFSAHAHSGLEPISCSLLRLIIVCALVIELRPLEQPQNLLSFFFLSNVSEVSE